jgi:hypothetical protein
MRQRTVTSPTTNGLTTSVSWANAEEWPPLGAPRPLCLSPVKLRSSALLTRTFSSLRANAEEWPPLGSPVRCFCRP